MTDSDHGYDLVVLGGGSAGETAASRVAAAGRRVALIESRLVGGECPYWGCVPSKAMLIAASRRRQAARAASIGAVPGELELGDPFDAWRAAIRVRDERAKHLDDAEAVDDLVSEGVEIVRGNGRVVSPGTVDVDGREVRYRNLLISLGADASIPPIDGLRDAEPWTSDDALTSDELPDSLVIIGGGAIGVELAQVYATFGTRVTVVEAVDRLMVLEEPEVSAAVANVLGEMKVELSVGVGVARVSTAEGRTTVHLEGGSTVTADRLLVATGRRPRVEGHGLEELGIDVQSGAVSVGADCRVPGHPNVFAAGDVTGKFPFTHMANYAGRVVAANVLGGQSRLQTDAIPRAVYIDPPVAGVGLTSAQAEQEGRTVVRASMDIGETARGWLENEGGVVVLSADADTATLLGGSALGARADEWMAQVTLAVRAQVPLSTLVDTVQPFPAVSEALFPAYEDLSRQLAARA